MAKLTDRQRKQIIAEYVGGGISQRELAQRYQVTQKTISTILNTEELRQKVSQKKEENTRSMLEFLESRREKAQSIIDKILDASTDDLEEVSFRDKMGAIKILSEVFAAKGEEHKEDTSVTEIVIEVEDASEADDETGD